MTNATSIEWTDATWNPTRGCSIASPGCNNCYAMGIAARFSGEGKPFAGYARFSEKRRLAQWTGKVGLVPEALGLPLTWRKPRRVFVNSMSDLFHEGLSDEDIEAVFGVMADSPHHTFQVLTKRAARMRAWVSKATHERCVAELCHREVPAARGRKHPPGATKRMAPGWPWPLPNVWLGVSVEDQARADERIPELVATPAAVRFVSYEPALGPVNFGPFLRKPFAAVGRFGLSPPCWNCSQLCDECKLDKLHWIIVGGESGRGARAFDVRWAELVVAQCATAGVACFVKQLGANPFRSPERDGGTGYELSLKSAKGGDMSEWSEDLRVRQFPEVP